MLINDAGIYYYQKSKRRRRRRSPFVLLVLILIFGWAAYIMLHKPTSKNKEVAGAAASQPISSATPTPNKQNDSRLGEVVKGALIGTKGSYGIVILNMKTGDSYFQNETNSYEAASLYKLWVMATVFEQIKNGQLREGDVLSGDLDVLRKKFSVDSPPEEITDEDKKEEGNIISFTVRDALMQMITISDNNAALLLSEKVSLENISKFLGKQAFFNSRLGTGNKQPSTTPIEIALFLKRLYEGKIVDAPSSKKMLDLLRWQKLNTKIPKYLPENLFIAHKTGELDEFNHDAGIVFAPRGDYIIVVMTKSDIASRYLAEERIAVLSSEVYKYFNEND